MHTHIAQFANSQQSAWDGAVCVRDADTAYAIVFEFGEYERPFTRISPSHWFTNADSYATSICTLPVYGSLFWLLLRVSMCHTDAFFGLNLALGGFFFLWAARLRVSRHHHHWRRRRHRRRTIGNEFGFRFILFFSFHIISSRMIALWAVPLLLSLSPSPSPPPPLLSADTLHLADVCCQVRWLISMLCSDFFSSSHLSLRLAPSLALTLSPCLTPPMMGNSAEWV